MDIDVLETKKDHLLLSLSYDKVSKTFWIHHMDERVRFPMKLFKNMVGRNTKIGIEKVELILNTEKFVTEKINKMLKEVLSKVK